MSLVLNYTARSDRGLVRANNEDSMYAGSRLLALADGMGGHAAGEVASKLVIQSLSRLDNDEPGNDMLGSLEEALFTGNEAIAAEVAQTPELEGMGTTLTALLFSGSKVAVIHVGDSRGYLLRDSEITQFTRDDTYVQQLVDEGQITKEQAHSHPRRSLIMQAITGNPLHPTLTMREARLGDRYLLCSDGLSDVVSEETIGSTLREIPNLNDCAHRLIELALRSGGPDNITVVLADVTDVEFAETAPIVGGAAGGINTNYQLDQTTAAGRAAALNPPTENIPALPIMQTAQSSRRRWWWLIAALAVVITLTAGFFIGLSVLKSHYFAGASNGEVVVYQGVQGSFFSFSLNKIAFVTCVSEITTASPTLTIEPAGTTCEHLRTNILTHLASNSLENRSAVNLDDAKSQVKNILSELLPLCPQLQKLKADDAPRALNKSAPPITTLPISPLPISPLPISPQRSCR